jgi:hypothetical protein
MVLVVMEGAQSHPGRGKFNILFHEVSDPNAGFDPLGEGLARRVRSCSNDLALSDGSEGTAGLEGLIRDRLRAGQNTNLLTECRG